MSDLHLQGRVERLQQAVALLDLPADTYHWQSIAVLLANGVSMDKLRSKLFHGNKAWFTDGIGETGYGCSLYLSPHGMPYYVGYGGHCGLYDELFGCLSQGSLDRAGWLHISDLRVDVHATMTGYQDRWLRDNEHRTNGRGWKINPYDGGDRRRPVPYEKAERFDVMPTRDPNDFARLERRIMQAQNPDRGVPGPSHSTTL